MKAGQFGKCIVDLLGKFLRATASTVWWMLFGRSESEEELRRRALEEQEREFHSFVRQQIVCLLLFMTLYLLSYWIISKFKSKSDTDSLYSGDEDYFVYRISVWICTFSLAVSIGSITLLPFSVLAAELIQRYPGSYYLQWLSWSLINSLWNYVFILSNLSLFVLLPFSYFFIESQGFSKRKNGIMQRVYETLAVCALLIVVILCLGDVVLTLMSSTVSLLSITSVNLPVVYSCVSLCGVVLLLLSTPIGFAKMFGIVGEMAMRPIPSVDELAAGSLEKKDLERRLAYQSNTPKLRKDVSEILRVAEDYQLVYRVNGSPVIGVGDDTANDSILNLTAPKVPMTSNDKLKVLFSFWVPLGQKSLRWYQHVMHILKYPVMIVVLLALTVISLLMVVINSLKLTFGYRSLPVYAQYMEVHTRHTLGVVGAAVEIVIILYIMATSLIGVYSMPFIRSLRPVNKGTSMTSIIMNCSVVLVLSSALPVLANTLGITTFDLLGAYSSLEWLIVTLSCITNQLTSPVRKQIMRRLNELRYRRERRDESFKMD
ncbi:unnamed protein product [Auanema sp. JU1783]|nr:unnamed protein product [Auanema sp. JU1783]